MSRRSVSGEPPSDSVRSHERSERSEAADGYVTEIPFPRNFIHQISPHHISLAAALSGHEPPPEAEFDYCEVGCGFGDTLMIMAASNPDARFVGIELSATHVENAEQTRTRAGLSNVQFIQRDIAALLTDDQDVDLPEFDFIAAHGFWTWVSAEKREALLSFVKAKLKPGGVFYVSYNALPGWAALAPLRHLMSQHADSPRGDVRAQAEAGVRLLESLEAAGAAYFSSHPTVKPMLALMRKGGPEYVVHEYLHKEWTPMYFTDVARQLRQRGLGFLGQVPLYLNVKELSVPPKLKKIVESVREREVTENLKDFANNEFFRCDLYVREGQPCDVQATQYFFESTPFGMMTTLSQIRRSVPVPHYTVTYKGPAYDTILAAIHEEPSSAMGLAYRASLQELGQARIGACLKSLVLGDQVIQMRTPKAVTSTNGTLAIPLLYNKVALEHALFGDGLLVLASDVTGRGVHITLLDALALHLVTAVAEGDRGSFLRQYGQTQSWPLTIGDRTIQNAEALVNIMVREVERFRAQTAPLLMRLGILSSDR